MCTGLGLGTDASTFYSAGSFYCPKFVWGPSVLFQFENKFLGFTIMLLKKKIAGCQPYGHTILFENCLNVVGESCINNLLLIFVALFTLVTFLSIM